MTIVWVVGVFGLWFGLMAIGLHCFGVAKHGARQQDFSALRDENENGGNACT